MSCAAITVPKPVINLGQLLRVIGLPTERDRPSGLVGPANDVIREVVAVVDGLVVTSLDQRSATAFMQTREEVFPQYVAAITALGSLARIVMPKQAIERLSIESFSEMEADLRDHGNVTFGSDITDRGLFTVWTLRKIYDLAKEIENTEPPSENAAADSDKAREFVRFSLWNRFHVDILTKAIRTGKPIYPEVKIQVQDGLRAAVDAYSHIRQWVDIRKPIIEPAIADIPWTEDDEMALLDSMRDLAIESA